MNDTNNSRERIYTKDRMNRRRSRPFTQNDKTHISGVVVIRGLFNV